MSKYFNKVLTALKSYKENRIEQALTETFYMLDNILKLSSVDTLLKSFDFLNDNDFDVTFEFLKFSHLNNEANDKMPFSFLKNENKTGLDFKSEKINENYCKTSIKNSNTSTSHFQNENLFEEENSNNYVKKTRFLEKNSTNSSQLGNFSSEDLNEIVSEIGKKEAEDCFYLKYYEKKAEFLDDEIYSFGGVNIDQNSQINKSLISYTMGTTANVVLIKDNFCYIANVGDSMAVLYKNGLAIRLNVEHKIFVPKERRRIIESGSTITNGRIAGRLNLTRALGIIFSN